MSAEAAESGRSAVPAVEVSSLSKRFGDVVAVDSISFEVLPGEVVGLLGPNGAGKTTTMRVLTGYLPPSEGRVRIAGHDAHEDALAARRAIGYLPEVPPLYPEMSVQGYLRYVTAIKGVPRARRRAEVDRALERCGLTEVRRRVVGTLSKGFRQRVGLAQAIVHDPVLLVLDEPTVGLDPTQIREIRRLITDLAAPRDDGERRTVLLSTHILTEVDAICDRVILLHRGRKAIDQPLRELTRDGHTLEEIFTQVTSRELDPAAAGAP